MLCVPCYVLLCHTHILEGLYDLISVESNRLLGIRIDSNRVDSWLSVCKSFRLTTQARKKVHYNVPV